jgi:type IV pilus assembly protein PilZ
MSDPHLSSTPSAGFVPPTSSGSTGAAAAGAPAASAGARPSVIQLSIKEKAALYAAYIPLFAEGGIFVPTTREHRLGDDLYLLITLPDDTQRYPVAGKVAWITPPRAPGGRAQGVGVRFPPDDISAQLKMRIEQILGARLASDRPTQTI